MQTPRTDSFIEQSSLDFDLDFERIIKVSSHEKCKDNISELLEMPFWMFFQMEIGLYINDIRQEEMKYNEYRMRPR